MDAEYYASEWLGHNVVSYFTIRRRDMLERKLYNKTATVNLEPNGEDRGWIEIVASAMSLKGWC